MSRPPSEASRARALLAARPELARLILLVAEPPADEPLTTPAAAAAVVRSHLIGRETEAFLAIALDRRSRVVAAETLTTGSSRFTVVDPPQILRWALTRQRAVESLIIAHNHPSGDPTPSVQDRDVTRQVASGCRAIGLRLADHLIVADPDRWFSFAATGEL